MSGDYDMNAWQKQFNRANDAEDQLGKWEARALRAEAEAAAMRAGLLALATASADLEAAIHSEPTMSGHLTGLHISPVHGEPALRAFKLSLSQAGALLMSSAGSDLLAALKKARAALKSAAADLECEGLEDAPRDARAVAEALSRFIPEGE